MRYHRQHNKYSHTRRFEKRFIKLKIKLKDFMFSLAKFEISFKIKD